METIKTRSKKLGGPLTTGETAGSEVSVTLISLPGREPDI